MRNIFSQKNALISVYVATLFYSFNYALPLYINSTFLNQFIPTEEAVGLVFAVSALLTIVATLLLPRALKKFGNYRTTLTAILMEIVVLLCLAIFNNAEVIIPLFVLNQTLLNILYLNLDTFLEFFSSNKTTGSTRGIFLTLINIAVVVAPFLTGMVLSDDPQNHHLGRIYLLAASCMVVTYFIVERNLRNHADPVYANPSFRETLHVVAESHDLHSIIFTHFLLNFFYTWMVIYTPIYLHEHMGIALGDILTIIIPIALIPFVVFQVFLGKLADTKFGEKEILALGFFIMAVSTGILALITSSNIFIWAAALFMTRVGASAVEIMAESYFYKKINAGDMHIITFMRTIRSSAYLVGPVLGSLVLAFVDYRFLFVILGAIVALGIPYSLSIKDTR